MVEIKTSTYWKFRWLNADFVHLLRKVSKWGRVNFQDTSGPYWIFVRSTLHAGTFEYVSDTGVRPQEGTWGFCLPPFSIIQATAKGARITSEMLICPADAADAKWSLKSPVVFSVPFSKRPLDLESIATWDAHLTRDEDISRSRHPDALAARIKKRWINPSTGRWRFLPLRSGYAASRRL